MIVDSSALIAIMREEHEADSFISIIEICKVPILLSAANFLEICLIIDRDKNKLLPHLFENILMDSQIIIEPVTVSQIKIARLANKHYGKGSGSKAMLNFGDCFAYALAQERGLPLLYKGDDFSFTDVESALKGKL